jgi:amino acid adenylation domain-containing protein
VPNITHHFFEHAQRRGTASALLLDGKTLSYGELAASARRIRGEIARAAAPFVGLLAHKSETAYAGVLGILAAGSAYVPLNPAFPVGRNRYIVEKANVHTLVVGPECADALLALCATLERPLRIVMLEPLPDDVRLAREVEIAGAPFAGELANNSEEAPAYVLFTSGSTGAPKGVLVRHGNVARYLENLDALYPLSADDRVTQTFDLTFDLSVHDMFTCWRAGATLVPYPASALASPIPFTQELGVTVWFSVPSVAAFLESSRALTPDSLPNLRLSSFCGEKLTMRSARIWQSVAPSSRIVNLYGPTETTIAITHFELPRDFDGERALHGVVPIGAPLPDQACEVRREDGTPCDLGETGALWLSGAQVSAGYLGEPVLTSERFVERAGRVWYRTGDLVVRAHDGVLHFVGREDFQVKIMGHRIELGEIEHALVRASGAAHPIAGVAQLRNGVDEIFAVLPARCAGEKKRLRSELKSLLPGYMIPRHFVFRDDLPLNANGKIDRKGVKALVLASTETEM